MAETTPRHKRAATPAEAAIGAPPGNGPYR